MKPSYSLSHEEIGSAVIEFVQKRVSIPDGDYDAAVTWHVDRDDRTQLQTITATCSFTPRRVKP